MALNGDCGINGHTHAHAHAHTRARTHTHTCFRLKLMRQIYDGCWPQQIKLTVMYVGGSSVTVHYRPQALTHIQARPGGGPLLPVLLVRCPCQAASLQHTCIMKFLILICVFPSLSFSSHPLSPPSLDSSCSQQTAPQGQLHI